MVRPPATAMPRRTGPSGLRGVDDDRHRHLCGDRGPEVQMKPGVANLDDEFVHPAGDRQVAPAV